MKQSKRCAIAVAFFLLGSFLTSADASGNKKAAFLSELESEYSIQESSIKVKGTVLDQNGEALIGATIRLKSESGNTTGTITDLDGNFEISVPNENAVLLISNIGYKSKEIKVGKQTVLKVHLEEDTQLLDDVVVVGFQTQKKANLTGSVASVGADVLENRPVANIGQALQGVVPNLNISINNGAPNTAPAFNIRGATSMEYDDNQKKYVVRAGSPLILLDGIEVSSGIINQLNPNDIKDMSVIKDASAAAIYGTKATYGVILIQTKTGGKSPKARINYSYDLAYDTPAAIPDILDAYTIQLAENNKTEWTGNTVATEAQAKLENIKKYMDNPSVEKPWYLNESNALTWIGNFNPYKLSVRDWTPTQKHNLSIAGGTENISYYLSLGFQDQEGMYKVGTDEYKRYNSMFNLSAKLNNRMRVSAKLSYNRTNYDSPYLSGGKGNLWSAMMGETGKNINMPIKTAADDPAPNVWTDNIIGWMSYGARSKSVNSTAMVSVSPEIALIHNVLNLKADFAFTNRVGSYDRIIPERLYVTNNWNKLVSEQTDGKTNKATMQKNNNDFSTINVYADFNKTIADQHNISAVAGFSQEKTVFSQTTVTYDNLFSANLPGHSASEDPKHVSESRAYAITGRALFGRINYNYAQRYFIEMNGRYDGSSRFTAKDRFQFFPSFSAAWRISEEAFMSSTRDWLDNLKLRGSWGELGNQPSAIYPYQSTYGTGKANYYIDGAWATRVSAPGLVSPSLSWEKAETINAGLDLAFLKNRLDLTFDIYTRNVTGVLTNGLVEYPAVLGAGAPLVNSGEITTRGWELSLNWKDRLKNGLQYSVGLNVSDNYAQVIKYEGNKSNTLGQLYSGQFVGEIWGYETGGILQKEDFYIDADGKSQYAGPDQAEIGLRELYPGYIWFKDLDGDGRITNGASTVKDPGDRKIIGNSTPRYRFGITAGASFKGFDLSLLIQGIAKRDIYTSNSSYWGGGAGNKFMYENSWTPERTTAKYPMYGAGGGNGHAQTGYLISGAYLRLKQLVIGYTVPASLTQKIGVDKVRVNLAGYNVFEITKIPNVFDPEQISSAYPQKRTVTFGVQVGF